jgi:CheY-like chemotaxis protein
MDEHRRALIIDDDETFCQFLAEVLEGIGVEAIWTTDGLQGYEMACRQQYDFFICDVRMPSILGTELAEKLRTNDPDAKIILISAFADEALLKTTKTLGVPLLSKPFGPDRLLDAVSQVVSV